MGAKGKKVTDRKDDQTENGSTLTEKQAERIRQSIELMAKTVPMKIDELLPYQRNQKDHQESQVRNLANSLRRFGWVQPVVVDEDNVIVIGHGRVLGAKLLGLTEAPVVRTVDLSEDEIRELRIIDNKLNESEWNEYLQQDVEELTFEGFDLDFEKFLTGGGIAEQDVQEDGYTGEPPAEPVAQRGDIFQLGRHRLMCGDSTDPLDVDKLMGGQRADVSITSPPYGESKSAKLRDHYERGKKKRESLYETHEDDITGWLDLLNGAFTNMRAHSTGQFLNIQMLADNKTDLISWLDAYKDTFVDVIIWDKLKAAPQMQSNVLNNQFEFVFVFCEENHTRAIPFGDFHGNTNNVIQLSVGQNEFADVHRAVYPVEFPATILRIASKAESVLDLFGGTGTTMIAAEQLGRSCYMMEIDPRYVDLIIDRWQTFTGQQAVKIS